MNAILNLLSLTLASADATASSNPLLRFVDWKRSIQGIAVFNPRVESYEIPAGVEQLIFDGSRTLTGDGTTNLSLTLNPLSGTTYRLTYASGTDPGFRTNRNLNLSGVTLTLAVQNNGTLLVTAGAGTPFAALQVSDQVFIPGALTGDPSGPPFNALNQGLWVVLAVGGAGANVTLVRQGDFQGIGETVTPAAAGDFLGYSAAGVQVGDNLECSLGFGAFEITEATAKWIEFTSTQPLAAATGTFTGLAVAVYTFEKRYIEVEADQPCTVRMNGDTGNTNKVVPWVPGDPDQVGTFKKAGPVWRLKVYNPGPKPLHVTCISVE